MSLPRPDVNLFLAVSRVFDFCYLHVYSAVDSRIAAGRGLFPAMTRFRIRARVWGVIILMIVALGAPISVSAETAEILGVRYWAAPDHIRIVLDTSEEVAYEVDRKEDTLLLTIKDSVLAEDLKRVYNLRKPGVEKVVLQPLEGGAVGMEVRLTGKAETKVFILPEVEDKSPRLVLDVHLPDVERKESEIRERVKKEERKTIVVIDPGHGGDDPGAVGRLGTYEKNVVLAISKRLKNRINARKGYRAFLTREGDYYVSFKKRLKIAREYGADLFVSIHTDASRSRRLKGASVYCISYRRASNEAALILARKENLADIVGGSANGESAKALSDPILLNMVQTKTMNLSKAFAEITIDRLAKVNSLRSGTVQEGPFMVLTLPEIPSVLVETAYISHPQEERLLRTPRFQQKIANAIADAVFAYLEREGEGGKKAKVVAGPQQAPPQAAPPPARTRYRVKRGDNLTVIARRHGTTVEELIALNRLKRGAPLYVGRELVVPSSPPPKEETPQEQVASAAKPAPGGDVKARPHAFYVVKKGDTMDAIARRHGTTLAELLEMNEMKLKDPLFAGRKIKVPPRAKGKPVFHVVRRGDTLDAIARRHRVTVAALKKANAGKHLEPLYVNQRLRIPGG